MVRDLVVKVSKSKDIEPVVCASGRIYIGGDDFELLDRSSILENIWKLNDDIPTVSEAIGQAVRICYRKRKPSALFEGNSLSRPNGYSIVGLRYVLEKRGLIHTHGDLVQDVHEYRTRIRFYSFVDTR
jgi:hypothetical protein